MKKILFYTLISIFSILSCVNSLETGKEPTQDTIKKTQLATTGIPKNAVLGDFNGDGQKESMWLIPPKLTEDGMECEDKCDCIIKFSDSSIPDLSIIDFCISGNPVNEGDLNDDGKDEIMIIPNWFTSTWRKAYVYHLKNGKWELLVKPLDYWMTSGINLDLIKKDSTKKNHVIISEFKWTEDMSEVVVASESVKIK